MHAPKRRRVEFAPITSIQQSATRFNAIITREILDELMLHINESNFTKLVYFSMTSRMAFQYVLKLVESIDSIYVHRNHIYFEFKNRYVEYSRIQHGDTWYKLAFMNTPLIAGITVCDAWLVQILSERTKPLIFDVTDMFRESDVLRFPCVTGIRVENYNCKLAKTVKKYPHIKHIEMTVPSDVGEIPKVRSLIVNLRYVKRVPAAAIRNWLHDTCYYDAYCVKSRNVPIIPTFHDLRPPFYLEKNESLCSSYHGLRRMQLDQKIPASVKRLHLRDHYYNAVYEKLGQPKLSLTHYLRFFERRTDYLEIDLYLRCDIRRGYTDQRIKDILDYVFVFESELELAEAHSRSKKFSVKVHYQYLVKREFFESARNMNNVKEMLEDNGFRAVNVDPNNLTYKLMPQPNAECIFSCYRYPVRTENGNEASA